MCYHLLYIIVSVYTINICYNLYINGSVNGTLNQSISLGKPTNIAKYDEIVGLKDKFIERLGDSHDRSLRGKKEKW